MFQQMVRLTLAATIWRKYKQFIIGGLALLSFWVIVNIIHNDYLSFAQLDAVNNQTYIAYSYGIKWLLIVLSAVVFVRFVKKPIKSKLETPLQERVRTQTDKASNPQLQELSDSGPDPFANIRNKKKLRSKADFILEGDKSNKKG